MKATTTATTQVEVPPLKITTVEIGLVGASRLVTHRFAQKAQQMILDKQKGKAKSGREIRNPVADFVGGLYPIGEVAPVVNEEDADNVWATGRFGFPAVGLKAAAVRAATDAGMKMTDARRAFHVLGELVEIECEPGPYMRTDMVRVGMGTADIRFRPEFREWTMSVPVRFNEGVFTLEKLVNLFRIAGFGVGIGEWRPEKNGTWGTFDVSDARIIEEKLL